MLLPPFCSTQHPEISVHPPRPGKNRRVSGWPRASPPGQELTPGELTAHLHDKALVVAAPGLGDELVLEATPLFVKFHNRVLAMLGQDRPLLFYVLRENRKENQKTQLRAFRPVEEGSCPQT